MISRMARPEEVLIVENEQGEVVREFMKDTDAISMYKNMRETLGMITFCISYFITGHVLGCFHHFDGVRVMLYVRLYVCTYVCTYILILWVVQARQHTIVGPTVLGL